MPEHSFSAVPWGSEDKTPKLVESPNELVDRFTEMKEEIEQSIRNAPQRLFESMDPNPPLKDDDVLENDPVDAWADTTVKTLEGVLKTVKPSTDPSFMVSLSVMVRQEEWQKVFGAFSDVVETMGPDQKHVYVSSTALDDDEEEL